MVLILVQIHVEQGQDPSCKSRFLSVSTSDFLGQCFFFFLYDNFLCWESGLREHYPMNYKMFSNIPGIYLHRCLKTLV